MIYNRLNLFQYNLCLFALIFLISNSSYAQLVTWLKPTWGKNYIANNPELMKIDPNGDIIIVSNNDLELTIDGYTPEDNNGSASFFAISKYNYNGDLIFLKNSINDKNVTCSGLEIDKDGNIYILGFFRGNFQYNNNLIGDVNNSTRGFLLKLDNKGTYLFSKQFGIGDFPKDIEVDDNQSIYISGFMTLPFELNDIVYDNHNVIEGANSYIFKLNEVGHTEWIRTGVATNAAMLQLDNNNNLYFAGNFQHYLNWTNDSIPSAGHIDNYFGKINEFGNILWLRTFSGIDFNYIIDFCLSSNGFSYFLGENSNSVTINDSTYHSLDNNNYSFYKLDPHGNVLWVNHFQSDTSKIYFDHIIFDKNLNLLLYGENHEFNQNVNHKMYGLQELRIDTITGKVTHIDLFQNRTSPNTIQYDDFGNTYYHGALSYNMQFDTILLETEYYSISYIAKIGNGINPQIPFNQLKLYPNPTEDLINIQLDSNFNHQSDIYIYNLQGKLVLKKQSNNYFINLNINTLNNGVYILELINNKIKMRSKIIKN